MVGLVGAQRCRIVELRWFTACYPELVAHRLLSKIRREVSGVRFLVRPAKLQQRIERLERNHAAAEASSRQLSDALTMLQASFNSLFTVVQSNHVWSAVARGTEWAATAPLAHHPLISVILPTRDRSQLVRIAIASIEAQSYPNWELVVVNDGSTDDTSEVLAAVTDDARIRVIETSGIGGGGARNAGIDIARGDFIAFLDDDNTMSPHWLRAIAEYTGRDPACQALYGAQLRVPISDGRHSPIDVLFEPEFDEDRLLQNNFVDLGTLAVSADHPQLRFDPELRALEDWELAVRIAKMTPLVPVPALASCYITTAQDRITDLHGGDDALAAMRKRFRG